MGLFDRLSGLTTRLIDGAARAVGTFSARADQARQTYQSTRTQHGCKPSTGERVMSHMMRGGVIYAWPGGWSQDRSEQVQHFRHWVYIAISSICEKIAGLVPNVALVYSEGPGSENGKSRHRAMTYQYLRKLRWEKSLHVIRPHEEVDPVAADYPLARLLAQPNPVTTAWQLWYELFLFLGLTGNGYLWAPPSQYGRMSGRLDAAELWVLPSHWVWPRVGRTGRWVDYYEIRPLFGSATITLPPEEVISLSYPNPIHKIDGWAPLTAIAEWVDCGESIDRSRFWSFKNGAFPVGAIELSADYADPDDNEIDRIGAKFYARYQGEQNAGKPIILPPGAKYNPLMIAPKEMLYESSANQVRDWTLAAYKVPKEVAGIQDAGSEIAMYGPLTQFALLCLAPKLQLLSQVLTTQLARRWDERLRVWWDDPAPNNPEQVLREMTFSFGAGAIAPNEIRVVQGREPYPLGGDNPFLGGKEMPWVEEIENPEPAPGMPGQPAVQPEQEEQPTGPEPMDQGEGGLEEWAQQAAGQNAAGPKSLRRMLVRCDHGENEGKPGVCPEDHPEANGNGHAGGNGDSGPHGQLAGKVRQALQSDVQEMASTPEGKQTLAKGQTIAEKVKGGIKKGVQAVLDGLDAETRGGVSLLAGALASKDPRMVLKGAQACFGAVFQCVHEEVFELALSQHALPGAHAAGAAAAGAAAKVETGLLQAVAWAWAKASGKSFTEALALLKAGTFTEADMTLMEALVGVAAQSLAEVLGPGVEIDRDALAKRLAALLGGGKGGKGKQSRHRPVNRLAASGVLRRMRARQLAAVGGNGHVKAPCKPGETAAATGCTPASGAGGGKKPPADKPARKPDKPASSDKPAARPAGGAKKPDPDANRPSRPKNRHPDARPKALAWRDPPPKVPRKEGEKFVRPVGDESQTKLGDQAEELARKLGFRNILPEGRRSNRDVATEGSSIDLEFDHSGRAYELKMCKTTASEYRLKAKASEKEAKLAFAAKHKVKPYVLIGVRDAGKGKIHFYAAKEAGMTGAEVSDKHFDYVGTVKIA